MNELWICGQLKVWPVDGGAVWEFQGVFDSAEKAEKACRSVDYFYFPAELNQELPDETQIAPRCWYPLRATAVE